MNLILRCCVLIFPLLFISCEKNDPVSAPPVSRPPSFAGEWSDPGLPMSISIAETNGEINGSGMLFNVFSLTVRGKNHYPTLTFTIGTPGFQSAVFTGTLVSRDSIVGSLSGSGFSNNTSNLKRIK